MALTQALVLLNPSSGTLAAAGEGDISRRIIDRLAGAGVTADVRFGDAKAIVAAAREARGGPPYAAVIVGGGDGTLNAVANELAGSSIPFGALPMGTHNHFAKDVGIPLDLDSAIDALAASIGAARGACGT